MLFMSTNETNLWVQGLITQEQIIQCRRNLQFVAVAACSDHGLQTHQDLLKQLTPYTFDLRSSEKDYHIVASGFIQLDHTGQAKIVVSRLDPKGLTEVSSIAAMLVYCNVDHADGGKLMWVEGLNCTVDYMMTSIQVKSVTFFL